MSIRRGLRVAFCGAGGTGKTTTAQFIENELEIPLLKSASRTFYEIQGLSEEMVNIEFTNEQKLTLQKDIFALKIENDRQFSYVADRTVLDHYAYALAYCGGFMDNDQFTEFDERVRSLMLSTYSHIFYFPWGFWLPNESDGVRQDRNSWQSLIDNTIVGHLDRWNVPVITVPQTHGEDARNDFVKSVILGEDVKYAL
jgi:hypothetical protein